MRRIGIAAGALLVVASCTSPKDDFQKNVCGAIEASGSGGEKDAKEQLKKSLDWSFAHVSTSAAKKVVGAVRMEGVAKTWIANLLREGAHEAGYDGSCALADAFERTYPCPPDDPERCGKDVK